MPAPADPALRLGVRKLTIDDVVRVARDRAPVTLSADALAKIRSARAVVERAAAEDRPVYGLTTGLGAGVDTRVTTAEQVAFQQRVPQARAVGVGPKLATEQVRAMMLMRAATFATGGAGVSSAVVTALLDALNAGFHPVVPALGSIGAGDLAPLAHAALALTGDGQAEFAGTVLPAPDALARAGLAPLRLGLKDGHALVVVNALSVGDACLVLHDAARVSFALEASIALSCEAFRASPVPLDPRLHAARPVPGNADAARRISHLLKGSALAQPGGPRKLHDPLCFRSAVPVHGALLNAMEWARRLVEIELNTSGDNPLVLADSGEILPNANFDVTALVLAFEALGQAMSHAATAACWRAIKLMSPRFSELPRFLTPLGQERTGFATVQKTLSALDMEIRHLALPASLAPLPVADGQEDVAQMATSVVAKTARIVKRLRWIAAIALVTASQAVDLRPVAPAAMGKGALAVHRFVRRHVPMLQEDRPTGPDFDRLADAIAAGEPEQAVAAVG